MWLVGGIGGPGLWQEGRFILFFWHTYVLISICVQQSVAVVLAALSTGLLAALLVLWAQMRVCVGLNE